MSYKKVFWGVILIFIGTLFILRNMGIVFFNWRMIFHLWPLLLILWGIAIIPIKSIYKLIISFVIVILTLFFVNNNNNYYRGHHFPWSYSFNYSDNDFDEDFDEDSLDYQQESNQKMIVDYENTEYAHLNFDAGAGIFTINESTDEYLAVFYRTGNIGRYSMKSYTEDNEQYIKYHLKDTKLNIKRIRNKEYNNKVNLLLNEEPIWDFDFDIGAAEINFDLSKFKVKNIDIDGGASDITITLGDNYKDTKIDIEAGVSNINIRIPKSSGCIVHTQTFLAGKQLDGFNKIKRGKYETNNIKTATNIIKIEMEAAISNLEIERY